MPYIGSSNSSNVSFMAMKEKHSINKKSAAQSQLSLGEHARSPLYNSTEEADGDTNSSIPSSASGTTISSPTRPYRPRPPSPQRDSTLRAGAGGLAFGNGTATNGGTPTLEKRSQSISSAASSVTDVGVQELYTLPNESTHSYSYNPLSPNSLAVRLSILKRSLEIIIGNPKIIENEPAVASQFSRRRSSAQDNTTHRQMRSASMVNGDRSAHRQSPGYLTKQDLNTMRRFSISADSSNWAKFNTQQIWTTPTAALNAFVANTTQITAPPDVEDDLDDHTTNVKQFITEGKTANTLKHRTNSLAFLPRIWNEYDFDPQTVGPAPQRSRSANLNKRRSSIMFRQPFPSAGTPQPVGGDEEVSRGSSDDDSKGEKEDEDEEEEAYIDEQRANLMSLLDLLNETLENNTSKRAPDLHMLSLFNINKLILDKPTSSKPNSDGESSDDEPFGKNKTYSEEDKHTLRLKKTLLDSLAEPFFERNISYEEANENEMTLRPGIDDLDLSNSQGSITHPGDAKRDYGRILHTFTSTKNSAPQAIFTCYQQHPWQFKAANDLACLIFGISKNVLKSLTLMDLIHTDSRNFVIHKMLATEDQELVFTGEIIGIVQPGSSNQNLIWASFWAKRKNGLLVCVFEKVPCDYVDVMLDLNEFQVEEVVNNGCLLNDSNKSKDINQRHDAVKHRQPKFELGSKNRKKSFTLERTTEGGNSGYNTESESSDEDSEEDSMDANTGGYTTPEDDNALTDQQKAEGMAGTLGKKSVTFANEFRDLQNISNSLAQLIEDVKDGKRFHKDDDLLPMAQRISNHINQRRYFTITYPSSNIPCAVSSSVLANDLKLKIHSLPYEAGLFIIDSHTLNLVSFNRSISKNMFGYHFRDLVDKPITKIIPSFRSIVEFIARTYPALNITYHKNRGIVLTEHFFRKMQAEIEGDSEGFYTSVGIDGVHSDGNAIKVDFQMRVLNPNYAFVWITHSRDVVFDDYKTNPSQLGMLNENEIAYMSSSGSSIASSKKTTTKIPVSELRVQNSNIALRGNTPLPVAPVGTSIDAKVLYRVKDRSIRDGSSVASTSSCLSSPLLKSQDQNIKAPIPMINTELDIKNKLAQFYSKDKSQFVKEGNFKVDQNLIISKISTSPILRRDSSGVPTPTEENPGRRPSNNDIAVSNRTPTTFLYKPVHNIGALKHSIKFSDFTNLQKMGEGAYGKVNLCMHKKEKYIVVIKMIFKERILVDTWVRDRKLGTIPSEIQIMATLNKQPHENILRLLDFFEDDDYYYIETPIHGETGCIDLFDLIELKNNMTEMEVKLIFKQIVSGIKHLHDQAIIHRDIKDENVIVDATGFVKLIDFGSAAHVKSGPFDVFVGTIDYAAPEVLSGDPYEGKPQDIWAIGILLYTIVFKENPFYNIDEILEGELTFSESSDVSAECKALISMILNRNVQKRPTIDDIYNDKWLEL
ncbi:serine/threonine protein kinase PSK1 KNAG_0D04810 [Huiozyma naganishii CBS 8797]|uniref:non-specific serine/threonine protein kinase n=1 Tax=Huiozyma naganishii (strain ATCC MYA-139 / BCRC 22969 / CBS 8797 / KCTC 17520 / NBRC 10181 / NCYC 3082 / Yp74L-3) TaxID=1071383 RepID=J7R5T5_HUIN7|nr:hypothetical protein KNAG_0D04810 [Kazachstania naganishii CBS 8797]CCK70220.1 hypothetical protein KNAG_0D04810 [Kazachstania naganishii CBS 8797]